MEAEKMLDVARLSLRDPAGQLFDLKGRLIRYVNGYGVPHLHAALNSQSIRRLTDNKQFISSEVVRTSDIPSLGRYAHAAADVSQGLYLEHPRIPFVSYPYEWAPEMLYAAGMLTLDLAEGLLEEGLGIKDATPYNILFQGSNPVFIDVLSVEKREALDPTWLAYAQFVRTFLNPLLVNKCFGMPLDMVFLTHRDGLEPEEVYRLSSGLQRFSRPFLGMVSIPTWLGSRHKYSPADYQKKLVDSEAKARFILQLFFKQLRKTLLWLKPGVERRSTWSAYMGASLPYSDQEFVDKDKLVDGMLERCEPKSLLDVGCNTGHFSAKAARLGAKVVAVDYDPVVVGKTWERAQKEKLEILPLRVDLTRPSPGIGWNNREAKGFLERAEGKFDTVMMLAVVHHMLVTEGIPLDEIVDMVSKLTTANLIIEYVHPTDPTFKGIARGRDHLYTGLTARAFEEAFGTKFELVESRPLTRPTRCLYHFKKKSSRS